MAKPINASRPLDQASDIELSIHKKPITKKGFSNKVSEVKVCGKVHKKPVLSVVIAAYCERDDLITNIKTLSKQLSKGAEVILVDNGLDKDIVKKSQKYDITYVKSKENSGCCGGRNIGASYVRGELIAFIDADGLIEDSFVKQSISIMKDKSISAFRGKVLPKNPDSSDDLPSHYNLGEKPHQYMINTEGISVWRTKLYNQAGGFEDSLYGGEGQVLGYRLFELFNVPKESFWYMPKVTLKHDYHVDKSHLETKISNREIAKYRIENRYPLINQFSSYYYSQRLTKPERQKIDNLSEKLRKKLALEFNKDYVAKAEKREKTPKLVRGKNKYDFTVVIPCYNLGPLLKEAIDSIRRQSIDSVEIIVVDDCSTNKLTVEILKELERKVKVVYLKKNSGVSVARNTGVKAASAELVLCLDADDTVLPTYLEKAKNIFEISDDIGVVSCWAELFGERNGVWHTKDNPELEQALLSAPVPTASCFRKKAWKNSKHGYDKKLRGHEDWDFWLGLMIDGWMVRTIPEPLFRYFTRPDSKVKTSNRNADKLVGRIVHNHKQSYIDNIEFVIGTQRKMLNEARLTISEYEKPKKQPLEKVEKKVQTAKKVYNEQGGVSGVAKVLKEKTIGRIT